MFIVLLALRRLAMFGLGREDFGPAFPALA